VSEVGFEVVGRSVVCHPGRPSLSFPRLARVVVQRSADRRSRGCRQVASGWLPRSIPSSPFCILATRRDVI